MEYLNENYKNPQKAIRWLNTLDTLRAKGNLEQVPEALRKCRKHAPGRCVLHETVQVELDVALLSSSDSRLKADDVGLHKNLVKIWDVVGPNLGLTVEDVFQAKITQACAGVWLGQTKMALNLVSPKLDEELDYILRTTGIQQKQTFVCLAKGAYARGISLVTTNTREAIQWYEKMLHVLQTKVPSEWQTDGFQMWYERFLASYCILVSHVVNDNRAYYASNKGTDFLVQPNAICKPYLAWSKFINGIVAYKNTSQRFMPNDREATRAMVWRAANNTISVILQDGFEDSAFEKPEEAFHVLQEFQANYNHVIMERNRFPPAGQLSPKMEEWVFQITANWKAVMLSDWCDRGLDEEDKFDFSNKLVGHLEAAVKCTFRSARIYRNLVMAFTGIGRPDMVAMALKSYIEMIEQAPPGDKTSSTPGPYVDNASMALLTLGMGMEVLCTYGDHSHVSLAAGLSNIAIKWLDDYQKLEDTDEADDVETRKLVHACTHRAIARSKATWARITRHTDQRCELLESAMDHFQASLSQEKGHPDNASAHYHLAVALVDYSIPNDKSEQALLTIAEAIKLLHRDVWDPPGESPKRMGNSRNFHGSLATGRSLLLKSWHLVVIITEYQDRPVEALATIHMAFKMYGGEALLRGFSLPASSGVPMSTSEKRRLIEIKMTQIRITQKRQPGEVGAQNVGLLCDELAHLWSLFFGEEAGTQPSPAVTTRSEIKQEKVNGGGTKLPVPTAQRTPPSKEAISPPSSSRKSIRKSLLHLPRHNASKAHVGGDAISSTDTSPQQKTSVEMSIDQGHVGRRESKKLQKHPSQRTINGHGPGHGHSTPATDEPITPVKGNSVKLSDNPEEAAEAVLSTVAELSHGEFSATLPTPSAPVELKTVEPKTVDAKNVELYSVPYSIDEIGIAVTNEQVVRPTTVQTQDRDQELFPYLSGEARPSRPEPPARFDPKAKPDPITPPPKPRKPFDKYPYIRNEIDVIHIPDAHFSDEALEVRADAFTSSMWLFMASVYRKEKEFADAKGCIEESKKCVGRIWSSIPAKGLSNAIIQKQGYAGLKGLGELRADVLAESAQILFDQASSPDISVGYRHRLQSEGAAAMQSALEFHPDHLEATLLMCRLALDKYGPLHEIEFGVDEPIVIAPIGPSSRDWPLRSQRPVDLAEIDAARADVYHAVFSLRQLILTERGYPSADAWNMLGEALKLTGDADGAQEVFHEVLFLIRGAHLAPSLKLENLL